MGSTLEAIMSGNHKQGEKEQAVRMELKYCEHCGGLWLRECGAGTLYCEHCVQIVADLPVPKKRAQRVNLPVRGQTIIERYRGEPGDDDVEAAGGAA